MIRRVSAAVAAALLASSVVAPQAEALTLRCHPVHVIQAAGTGFSHSWHPDARDTLFDDSSSPADGLQIRFGARTVTTFQVKYPASLGRFSALSGTIEGSEAATYGESIRYGRDVATLEMETVARQCPSTRFILIGYSQGAHLIGDAAAEVAAGLVPGVTADHIAAVVLFADPARAPLAQPVEERRRSRRYAAAPPGVEAANFETVQVGGTHLDPTRVGMAGTRPRSFNGLQGKVLSLCSGDDMACATPPDSVIRAVADVAMRDVTPGPPNAITGIRVARLTTALGSGLSFSEALAQSGLSLIDVSVAPQILIETSLVLRALYDHTAAGNPTPPEQLAAVAVLSAAPNLIKEGAAWPWLFPALHALRDQVPGPSWFDVALEALHLVDATERLALTLSHMGVLPDVVTGTDGRRAAAYSLASDISESVIDRLGLRPAADANPGLVESAALAGDFGPRHQSYYKLGYTSIPGGFSVAGETGYDFALGWMSEVVRGVVDTQ